MLNQNLKQRLIGAAVLIGAGVLIIPFLLKGPPGIVPGSTAQSGNGGYAGTFKGLPAEGGDSFRQHEAAGFVSAADPEQSSQNLTPPDKPGFSNALSPSVPVPDSLTGPENSIAPGWRVQIGSFAHQGNALRMRDKALASGYKAFIKPLKKGDQIIYKVRIGPTENLDHAKELKQALERQWRIRAFLISPADD